MNLKLKQWLLQRGSMHKQNLIIFLAGAGLFFLGMLLIFLMNAQTPSIQQEATVIVALILVVIGALIAAFGYICLSFLRFYLWLQKDK